MPVSTSSSSDSEDAAARFASVAVDGDTISTQAAAAAEVSRQKSTAKLEHRKNREETAGGRPAAARRAREQEEEEGNRLPPAVREKVREGKEKGEKRRRSQKGALELRLPFPRSQASRSFLFEPKTALAGPRAQA